MSEVNPLTSKSRSSADWMLRGVLTKLGDIFDRFTGRRWTPSSSLAASELSERMKKLLDAEARAVPGKGLVVPHNIKLKIQWDKFSTDSEASLRALETELLTTAVDHINDSLYYTYAPLSLEVKPDYFTEGVKLLVSFDKFEDEDTDAEINVTVPSVDIGVLTKSSAQATASKPAEYSLLARIDPTGVVMQREIACCSGGRVTVGRTGENGLNLNDISVSKFHAALAIDESGQLTVADTGSTNGTFINGERIAYGKAMSIGPDDTVKFGTVEVKFQMVAKPSRPEPEIEDPAPLAKTVEIDGFEFTSRSVDEPEPIKSNETKSPTNEENG